MVKVQFVADCWTQVTDANGKVLVSALKRKGDSLELASKAPLGCASVSLAAPRSATTASRWT